MKKFLLLSTLLLSFLLIPINSLADEKIPFTITPILPDNQDPKITNYISINSENNIDQNIQFKLENKTEESQEMNAEIVNSYTSSNGSIQYEPSDGDDFQITDKNYELKNYISYNKKIKLEPGESKTISIPLKIDNKGTTLGAIKFHQGAKKNKNNDSQFTINNEVDMIVGIKTQIGESNKIEIGVGDPFVEELPSSFIIKLPIEMKTNNIASNSKIEYNVCDKDGNVLFSNEKNINFAPKSKTNLSLQFESKDIVDGETYSINGKIKYDNGVKEFEKKFTYDKEQSLKLNQETAKLEKSKIISNDENNYFTLFLIALILLLALLILVIILFKKNRDKNKQLKKK